MPSLEPGSDGVAGDRHMGQAAIRLQTSLTCRAVPELRQRCVWTNSIVRLDICRKRGLTGTQSVLIPKANVQQHLMLTSSIPVRAPAAYSSLSLNLRRRGSRTWVSTSVIAEVGHAVRIVRPKLTHAVRHCVRIDGVARIDVRIRRISVDQIGIRRIDVTRITVRVLRRNDAAKNALLAGLF